MKILVTGAGGTIGGHLVRALLEKGYDVRAVDIKDGKDWFQVHAGASNYRRDLRHRAACEEMVFGMDWVFDLAEDMGGISFIEHNRADCIASVLIGAHMLISAKDAGVSRFFYSSSACAYNTDKQSDTGSVSLKEEDAWPARPERGYGLQKLFMEEMCVLFSEDYGINTRIARYHNVYGSHSSFQGGREKAPAAICRKVIEAKLSGKHEIEIWGDGEQTRSFMFIDDCVKGTLAIMASDIKYPINLGSSELVSINQLVSIVEEIAGIRLKRTYDLNAPKGVRGRNSDNARIKAELGWEPSIPLRVGLEKTYAWIYDQMTK